MRKSAPKMPEKREFLVKKRKKKKTNNNRNARMSLCPGIFIKEGGGKN